MVKFESIKPGPFNDAEVSRVVREWMKDWGENLAIPEFDRVTSGWQGERPVWKQIYRAGANWIENIIEPEDPNSEGSLKWLWLDLGTAGPYPIPSQPFTDPKKRLAFPSVFFPGSMPGSLTTTSSIEGGDLIFRGQVMHPGIEPRGWSEMLIELLTDSYYQFAQEAFVEAARASGQGKE